MKGSILVLALGVAGIASAQSETVSVSASVDQFFVAGGFGDEYKTESRLTRPYLSLDSGAWALVGSYWFYPTCDFQELDETHLTYSHGDARFRLGRFRIAVGQNNWDDQWYSGHVFLPMIETADYGDFGAKWHTSVGAEAAFAFGAQSVTVSVVSKRAETDSVFTSNLDRGTVRWQGYRDGVTIGASAMFDMDEGFSEERLLSMDVRWAVPHWGARAEVLGYSNSGDTTRGFFVDVYHRPKGWTDVTLLWRYQGIDVDSGGYGGRHELVTFGAKMRAPFDTSVAVNYTYGPGMNDVFLGGGWAIGVSRTFRF